MQVVVAPKEEGTDLDEEVDEQHTIASMNDDEEEDDSEGKAAAAMLMQASTAHANTQQHALTG
jgi:hypothetical protein